MDEVGGGSLARSWFAPADLAACRHGHEKGRESDPVPRLLVSLGRLSRLALARDGHGSPANAGHGGRRDASDEELVPHAVRLLSRRLQRGAQRALAENTPPVEPVSTADTPGHVESLLQTDQPRSGRHATYRRRIDSALRDRGAFFYLEAIFIAIYRYSWRRLSPSLGLLPSLDQRSRLEDHGLGYDGPASRGS